jgi:hypothetical protein
MIRNRYQVNKEYLKPDKERDYQHFINEFMKHRTLRVAEITPQRIEEPIKIIGYANDWIILKQEWVSVLKLQKAMDKIFRWAHVTGFQISIEKTKVTMFSRKRTGIASRPRLKIWIKGVKIEQVTKHKILGSIFDTWMNWNDTQNDNTKHFVIRRRGLRLSIQISVKKSSNQPTTEE